MDDAERRREKGADAAGRTPAHEDIAREDIERLAHQYWLERGGGEGRHEEDWLRAEQDLRRRRAVFIATASPPRQSSVVAAFDSIDAAQRAYEKLVSAGFRQEDISFVANKARARDTTDAAKSEIADAADRAGAEVAADTGIGAALGGVGGLLLTLAAIAVPAVGPVLVAGPIVGALGGAGIGAAAGGLIGALTETGLPEDVAQHYAEGVRRGDVLITVRGSGERAERASEILHDAEAVDINQRVSAWRARGWTGYDPAAEPLTADELRREREYYTAARDQEKEWTRMSDENKGGLARAEAENAEEDAKRTTRAAERAIGAGRRDVEQRDLASQAGSPGERSSERKRDPGKKKGNRG